MAYSRAVEIGVGSFVAIGVAALFFLAFRVSNPTALEREAGYTVIARFGNVGGLKVRAPVTAAGVRLGRVAAIEFDGESFEAVVRLHIDAAYAGLLPADTAASIFSSGLLGEQYVGLEPGGSDAVLEDGDELPLTQSALILEQIIGQFLFQQASDGGE